MKKAIHQQDVSIKAPSRQMWRRSLLILAAVCLCFGAVGGKLAVIQIGEYAVWQERAMEQQMSNSIISPKRGLIYDTNMEVLAQTKEVATIIMAPSEIPDEATRTLIADELSVLLEINRDALYKKTGKKTSLYEVIKAKIDHSLCDTLHRLGAGTPVHGIFPGHPGLQAGISAWQRPLLRARFYRHRQLRPGRAGG